MSARSSPAWAWVPNASASGPVPAYRCDVGGVPVEFHLYSKPGSQWCVARPSTSDSLWRAKLAHRPIPGWAVVSMPDAVITEASGWPALCLKHSAVVASPGGSYPPASVANPGAWRPLARGNPPLTLPLAPIASGLAINTAFYGSLVLARLCLLPWARSALRRHRNHCPRCNYDLRATSPGSPCPECGRLTIPRKRV